MVEKNFQSAQALIEYVFELGSQRKFYFRGISSRNQLLPSIMRVRKGDAEKDFSFCEDEILKTFIKIGSSSYQDIILQQVERSAARHYDGCVCIYAV